MKITPETVKKIQEHFIKGELTIHKSDIACTCLKCLECALHEHDAVQHQRCLSFNTDVIKQLKEHFPEYFL